MNTQFHKTLNRMALFTALVGAALVMWHEQFLAIALNNIWLNGVIIGTTLFGVGSAFVDMFRLLPEYNWLRKYFYTPARTNDLPPRLFRPIAIILNRAKTDRNRYISPQTLDNFLNIILGRFEDSREAMRYITNTLVFLGLLGTFWGLIATVGGFADLIGAMDFADENVMSLMQQNLAIPLGGMGTAFSTSLFGLAGSLIVGFLGLQTQLAQNAIFRELEENLSDRARLFGYIGDGRAGYDGALPYVNAAARDLSRSIDKLEKTIGKIPPHR
ncbi:MAG: flagellar motor protein MotA [Alphaproteobacteria bacterium]|nr:flagellar motor protein MotA [Alphaproteobacteria bacterium]